LKFDHSCSWASSPTIAVQDAFGLDFSESLRKKRVRLQVSFGNETALIYSWQIVIEAR
jgi:hypothetical protein